MTNLNEGVGKKIVEALKKQSEIESSGIVEQPAKEPENLGIDVSSIDEITNQGLMSSSFDNSDEKIIKAELRNVIVCTNCNTIIKKM